MLKHRAFSSQLWSPLRHSSCSVKKGNTTDSNLSRFFSVTWRCIIFQCLIKVEEKGSGISSGIKLTSANNYCFQENNPWLNPCKREGWTQPVGILFYYPLRHLDSCNSKIWVKDESFLHLPSWSFLKIVLGVVICFLWGTRKSQWLFRLHNNWNLMSIFLYSDAFLCLLIS